MDKDGYITDQDLFHIYGKEPNFLTGETYKDQWRRLNGNRNFFKDKEILYVEKYRGLRATLNGEEWYRLSPDYWEEIKSKFIRDYQYRPDLHIERYKLNTSRTI